MVVVLALDLAAAGLLFPPETRKTIPTITPTMTTTMMPLRICLRRFCLLRLGGQPRLPGRALAGSLVAGHGPRPYPIPGPARIALPVGASGPTQAADGRDAVGPVRSL